VTGLLEVIVDVNKNFVSTAVKGTLMLVAGSVNLAVLQASAADSGANILPVEWDVRRVACAMLKKWWHSFGYNYVLATIQARLCEVNVRVLCVWIQLDGFNFVVCFQTLLKETKVDENVRANAVIDDRPEGTIDAEVTRIRNENVTSSDGLQVAKTVSRVSTDDTNRAGESEVWF
jgi:hypothetical protein